MKLPNLQTDSEMYSILSLDQSEELLLLFGLDGAETSSINQIHAIELLMAENIAEKASAVVLDPRSMMDIPVTGDDRPGIIYRLTQTPFNLTDEPKILPKWGVEFIANNYGVAKIRLPYHPQENLALEKKKFLAETFDFCHFEKIDLILDLKIISPDGNKIHPDNLAEVQLQAIQELRGFADLFALQYPGDPLSCATLTAELDRDWILASDGRDYANFKEKLREALDSGAKGFMIGDSLWGEMGKLRSEDHAPDFDQIPQFIQTTIRDRVIELSRILEETAKKEN